MDETVTVPEPVTGCRPCEIFWGTVGIVAGLAVLLIGLDLITDGRLTALSFPRRTS